MDSARFTENATGDLVQIDRAAHPQKKDWAFIPAELPQEWFFHADLWPMVAEARERLGELNGVGQNLDDPDLLLHPLQNREAITSSQIEGTFVTAEQLLLYEMNPKEETSAQDRRADWREVMNYNRALNAGREMIQDRPINNHVIRSMHSVLMKGVRGADKSPGQFREKQVQIGSTARYIAPPSTEVERLMQNLEKYIASDDLGIDPLVRCFIAHYQFEAIHPFEDGNGRVGRAMLALMIHKVFGHEQPWLYLSAFFDKYQDEYFRFLFQVSANGEWGPWIAFCLTATIAQANDAINRCNQFKSLKASFHDRITPTATARSHQIIEMLFRNPIIRITRLSKEFDIHYQTAQSDVQRLVDVGILAELAEQRPKTFFAAEIMEIAYGAEASF